MLLFIVGAFLYNIGFAQLCSETTVMNEDLADEYHLSHLKDKIKRGDVILFGTLKGRTVRFPGLAITPGSMFPKTRLSPSSTLTVNFYINNHSPTDPGNDYENLIATKTFTVYNNYIGILDIGTVKSTDGKILLDDYVLDNKRVSWSGEGVSTPNDYNYYFDPSVILTPQSPDEYKLVRLNYKSSKTTRCPGVTGIEIIRVEKVVNLSLPFSSICANETKTLSGGTPSGGVYSIDGTQVTSIDANKNSGTGTITVTYTYKGEKATDQVAIKSLPTVDLPAFSDVYVDGSPVVLNSGSPGGGIYKYNGNKITSFNPASYSPGTYTITYTAQGSNQCFNTTSNTIKVLQLKKPGVNIPDQEVCKNWSPQTLISNLNGGKITINGTELPGGIFDPASYAQGVYNATYSRTNYADDNFKVTVNGLPSVSFAVIDDICSNGGLVDLSNKVSPQNGIFSGLGIMGSDFNGEITGKGDFDITYTFTDVNKCVNSASQSVTVLTPPVCLFYPVADQCQGNGIIDLKSYVSQTGGVFSGVPGAINGSKLDLTVINLEGKPKKTVTITYTLTNSSTGCTTAVTNSFDVKANPVITYTNYTGTCEDSGNIPLDNAKPTGGKYSCVSNSKLIAAGNFQTSFSRGGNSYPVTYTYTDPTTQCVSTVTKSLPVLETPKVTLKLSKKRFCKNDLYYSFTGGSPLGSSGYYLLNGEKSSGFNPKDKGTGDYTVTYVYQLPNGCDSSADQIITILPSPTVTLKPFRDMCPGSTIALSGGSPSGKNGSYLINGTKQSNLETDLYDFGVNEISYLFVDENGCSAKAIQPVNILQPLEITHNAIGAVCESEQRFEITGASVTGGEYTGSGVINNQFEPNIGKGIFLIKYTKKDEITGCISTIDLSIEVLESTFITIKSPGKICENADVIDLNFANVGNGQYYINDEPVMKLVPSLYSKGIHKLSVAATNKNGCESTAVTDFEITDIPIFTMPVLGKICKGDGTISLPIIESKGHWEGDNIQGNNYLAHLANVGLNNLTFSSTNNYGCTVSKTTNIEVVANPEVTFPVIPDLCKGAEPYLIGGGLPIGGKIYVDGTEAGIIYPENMDTGKHTSRYVFINETGCIGEIVRTFNILPQPLIIMNNIDPMCQNEDVVPLNQGYPTGKGSLYKLNSKLVTEIDPNELEAGSYPVTFEYTNSYGCSNSITKPLKILSKPEVVLDEIPISCANDAPLKLTGGHSSGQGKEEYYGNGVINEKLICSIGAGSYPITYKFTNENGCSDIAVQNAIILPSPDVKFSLPKTICQNDAPLLLNHGYPEGGFYELVVSGEQDVVIKEFNPKIISSGMYSIRYTYENDAGCSESTIDNIEILKSKKVVFDKIGNLCQYGDKIELSAQPEGGKFYYKDIQISEIDPVLYKPGKYKVEYVFNQENACSVIGYSYFIILNAPENPSVNTESVYCPGSEIKLESLTKDYTVNWYDDKLISLKEDNTSVTLKSDEPFTAFVQYSNSKGCKSKMTKLDINVEKMSTNIETNFYEIEQGEALQLQSNVRTDGEVKQYLWEFTDGARSYERNPWHYFDLIGANGVKLTVTTNNGCIQSQEVKGLITVVEKSINGNTEDAVEVIVPKGNDDPFKVGRLYPNPTTDKIQFNLNKSVKSKVNIYSLTGSLLYSDIKRREGTIEINVSQFNTGVYFITIINTEDNSVITKQKFIKK